MFQNYLPSRQIVILAAPESTNHQSLKPNLSKDFYTITHQPQNEFEKPLTALNCFVVSDETPPNIDEYGSLKRRF